MAEDPLAAAEANANAAMASAESSSSPEADQTALTALSAQEAALKAKEDSLRASMQTAVAIRDAQAKKNPKKPLAMANINEEAITQADPSNPGQKFFFGSVGVIKFGDKTSFHVSRTHMTVHNPTVIANLIEASKLPKNPNRIFLES